MKKSGFTLVEIMIVVAIIGLLAAIAIPSFMRARSTSQQNACINNLRQLSGAEDQFAIENNKVTGDACASTDITPYLKKWPICPASGAYTISTVGSDPTCNITGHTL
jgi:prepilin-type N-terminal cleavage/methylation domain-containing protein